MVATLHESKTHIAQVLNKVDGYDHLEVGTADTSEQPKAASEQIEEAEGV